MQDPFELAGLNSPSTTLQFFILPVYCSFTTSQHVGMRVPRLTGLACLSSSHSMVCAAALANFLSISYNKQGVCARACARVPTQ